MKNFKVTTTGDHTEINLEYSTTDCILDVRNDIPYTNKEAKQAKLTAIGYSNFLFLHHIHVAKQDRGEEIGREVIRQAKAFATVKKLTLLTSVPILNEMAYKMFLSLGFTPIATCLDALQPFYIMSFRA